MQSGHSVNSKGKHKNGCLEDSRIHDHAIVRFNHREPLRSAFVVTDPTRLG